MARAEPILLFFFHFFFLSTYFFLTYFARYFAHYLTIFLHIKDFSGVSSVLSMHDCCIRIIYNKATALLEYLDLIAVFPEAYFEYLHLCNAKYAKL